MATCGGCKYGDFPPPGMIPGVPTLGGQCHYGHGVQWMTNTACKDYVPRYGGGGDDGEGCLESFGKFLGGAAIVVFIILVVFAPGMVITSLFSNYINTSLWAWIWSVVFSIVIIFLVALPFIVYVKSENIAIIGTLCTYAVLSGLSIWLLFASEASNIVKTCNLLKFNTSNVTPNATVNPDRDLQIVSLKVNGDLFQNQIGSFTATVKNNGNGTYNSRLWIYMEKPVVYSPNQVVAGDLYSIAAGESKTITIEGVVTLPPDVYDCNMIFDSNNNPSNMATFQFHNLLRVQASVKSSTRHSVPRHQAKPKSPNLETINKQ